MAKFDKQRPLFKAYDIRGKGVLFTDVFIDTLAHAFVKRYQYQMLSLGFDARPDSSKIAHRFYHIFKSYDITVQFVGLATTPMVVHASHTTQNNAIIITASHSPKDILGVKWLVFGHSPTGDEIMTLFKIVCQIDLPKTAIYQNDIYTNHHCMDNYIGQILAIFTKLNPNPTPKTLVIDCLHGATGQIATQIFGQLTHFGYQVILLNNTPNGNYPKGDPDPAKPNRLRELSQAVTYHQADLGFAFDGDGDRLAVVDDLGQIVLFDWLIFLLAKASHLANPTKKSVLYDVKCTHRLNQALLTQNLSPIISQTGSNHLRRAVILDNDIVFAGELSGHFIINDGLFIGCDDGVYSAIRLLCYLDNQDKLSNIIANLPQVVATDDIYLDITSPKILIDTLISWLKSTDTPVGKLSFIDGVRLDTPTGFGLVRASNTSDSLTVRFAGDDINAFWQTVNYFITLLPSDDKYKPLKHALQTVKPTTS